MNIVHVATMQMKTAHGMRYSIPGLVSGQNKIENVESVLVNLGELKDLNENDYLNYDFPFYKTKEDFIENFDKKPDIIIYQGIYKKEFLDFYKFHDNIPYVIVPRSSFTREAQSQKKLKKIIGNKIIFNKFINQASSIHFLTEEEHDNSLHFSLPSFISGNGTELNNLETKNKSEKNKYSLTYIGRYDINHKGLDLLVEALSLIKETLVKKNVQINFYGTNYKKNKEKLLKKITKLELEDHCKVNGAVFGKEKLEVLHNTDLFLATSRFEGHPQSVIEAMAHGIPCILTPGTNMQRISTKYNASWNVEQNIDSIAQGILAGLNSKEELLAKGKNAKTLAFENYSWSNIAKQTVFEYKNIISKK